ncbi:unnamed protein product [Amoebophrya sp. A25]|nr:unnamed protein product [Amoebophrya sp. A25]|eukprot:GSA25T00018535001.1
MTTSSSKTPEHQVNFHDDRFAYVPNTQVCVTRTEYEKKRGTQRFLRMFQNPKHFRPVHQVEKAIDRYAEIYHNYDAKTKIKTKWLEEDTATGNQDEEKHDEVGLATGQGARSEADQNQNIATRTQENENTTASTVRIDGQSLFLERQSSIYKNANEEDLFCYILSPDPEMEELHYRGLHNKLLRSSLGLIPIDRLDVKHLQWSSDSSSRGGADLVANATSTTRHLQVREKLHQRTSSSGSEYKLENKPCKYFHLELSCAADPDYMLHMLLLGVNREKSCLGLPLPEKWARFTRFDWELFRASILDLEASGHQSMAPVIRNNAKCQKMLEEKGWSLD